MGTVAFYVIAVACVLLLPFYSYNSFSGGKYVEGTFAAVVALVNLVLLVAPLFKGISVPLPRMPRWHNCPLCHSSPCRCRG